MGAFTILQKFAHKKSLSFLKGFCKFAVWTRLELATPCVTGRYSNQLNYQTVALLLAYHFLLGEGKYTTLFNFTKPFLNIFKPKSQAPIQTFVFQVNKQSKYYQNFY